jgi:hypothetical protein
MGPAGGQVRTSLMMAIPERDVGALGGGAMVAGKKA